MDVKLIIEHPPAVRKRKYRLRADEGVIGRAGGCAIRIDSAEVSRQHCRLRVRDGYLTVEDLKSRNGTQVNGEEVQGRQVVRPGDRLRIGPVTFIVEYQLTPEAIDRLLRGEGVESVEEDLEVVEEGEAALVFDEDGLLPLEGLAEGEVEEVEPVEEEMEELQPVEEVTEEQPVEAVDELELVDASDIQLPQSEELRDILTGLDDEDDAPKKKRKKKR